MKKQQNMLEECKSKRNLYHTNILLGAERQYRNMDFALLLRISEGKKMYH